MSSMNRCIIVNGDLFLTNTPQVVGTISDWMNLSFVALINEALDDTNAKKRLLYLFYGGNDATSVYLSLEKVELLLKNDIELTYPLKQDVSELNEARDIDNRMKDLFMEKYVNNSKSTE